MPIQDIILRVKSVAEIHALANTYNILKKLESAGIDVNKPLQQIDKRMKQLHVNTTKVARVFKPFRMELLSVMFGAQMVSRAITGLFQPALQMAGVFELLGVGLAVFFLPAVMALLTPLIDLVNWFIELPEPVKLIVGAILGVVAAFFTFLATEAAYKLFFQGFLQDASAAGDALDGLKVKAGEFANLAGKAYAFSLVFSGIDEISKGKVFSGIAETLKGAGIFAVTMGGKNKAFGGWMLTAGLALDVIDTIAHKERLTMGAILNQIIQAGIAGWALASTLGISGAAGAGLAILAMIAIQDIVFGEGILHKALDWVDANIIQPIKDRIAIATGKTPSVEYYIKDAKEKGFLSGDLGGGYISQTGLYKLHAGESVSTAGDTFNSSPVINVYGGGMNTSDLVRQIADEVTRNLSSMARR